MEGKRYYLTTPIYYPNGRFHIGTAYTTILADAIKKYKQMSGYEVYLTTGNDEHGQKIEDTAISKGQKPQEFVDMMAEYAKNLWKELKIDYNDFVRTTDKSHEEQVQKIFEYLLENGDIYKGKYVGNYCKSDESYFTDLQLVDGRCPDCGKEVVQMEEESYFFNMKKYQKRLEEYYEKHDKFILPEYRKNEVLNNFIRPGLEDLSVTRTSFNWGIKVKSDPKHVVYVWLDALTNYITFLGYDIDIDTRKIVKKDKERLFDKFWPANLHIVGKDIVRFHAIYWPIFLMALGIEEPETIYAHNWFVRKDGKMSKSVGNVIYPEEMARIIGLDVLRYILLREMPYTHDGVISDTNVILKYNTELCNDFSNLIYRTMGMIRKYELENDNLHIDKEKLDTELLQGVCENISKYVEYFEGLMIQKAIEEVLDIISKANKYIDSVEPWKLFKEKEKNIEKLNIFIYTLVNIIKIVGILFSPIMPETSEKVFESLNLKASLKEDYAKLLEGIAKKEIFEDIVIKPNSDSKPIFERLTEDKEEEIRRLF